MFRLSLFLCSNFLSPTPSPLSPEETYLTPTAPLGLREHPTGTSVVPVPPQLLAHLSVAVPGLSSVNLCPEGSSLTIQITGQGNAFSDPC